MVIAPHFINENWTDDFSFTILCKSSLIGYWGQLNNALPTPHDLQYSPHPRFQRNLTPLKPHNEGLLIVFSPFFCSVEGLVLFNYLCFLFFSLHHGDLCTPWAIFSEGVGRPVSEELEASIRSNCKGSSHLGRFCWNLQAVVGFIHCNGQQTVWREMMCTKTPS